LAALKYNHIAKQKPVCGYCFVPALQKDKAEKAGRQTLWFLPAFQLYIYDDNYGAIK
jgi:hypothetical protein